MLPALIAVFSLRLVNACPDVELTAELSDSVVATAPAALAAGKWVEIPAGKHTFTLRAWRPLSGGALTIRPPVFATHTQIWKAGRAYTIVACGPAGASGGFGTGGGEVSKGPASGSLILEGSATPPPAGKAAVRTVHLARGIGPADVAIEGGARLAKALAFGKASKSVVLPGGPTPLSVKASLTPGGAPVTEGAPSLAFAAGTRSLLVVGRLVDSSHPMKVLVVPESPPGVAVPGEVRRASP